MASIFKVLPWALCLPAVIFAGTKETVDVIGVYKMDLGAEISPREAMDRAYADAKKKALEDVVGTEVKSWEASVLSTESGQSFSSLMLQTAQGIVRKFEVKRSGWKIEAVPGLPEGLLNIFCEARVCVEKIDAKPDPELTCRIAGARADYRDGERVKFTVTSSQDAYLTVFLLDARLGGTKVFPNRTFRKSALQAEEAYELPRLTFMKTKEGAAREQGVLMFVLTKRNVPFLAPPNGCASADEINAWLADIPADERFFCAYPFFVSAEGEAIR